MQKYEWIKKDFIKRLEDKLRHVKRVQTGKPSNYEKGGNGRIVFEDRHTAIFASAVSYALKNSLSNKEKLQTLLQTTNPKDSHQNKTSTISHLLSYLGLL